MSTQQQVKERGRRTAGEDTRERLLSGLPVTERRVQVPGVSTAENARDDPAIERPEAFLEALRTALDVTEADQAVRR